MFTVFGFYKFQKINDLKKNQKILSNLLTNKNINGSIIISKEGLNGSISGINKDIKTTIIRLKKILNIKEFDCFNNWVIVCWLCYRKKSKLFKRKNYF